MGSAHVVAVSALAAIAACSSGPPARPAPAETPSVETRDFGSGARLRARAWEVDGALVLRDFFDTARGETCSFVENGIWHVGPGPSYWCLPVGLARHDLGFGPFAVFSNSVCTERVAVSPPGGPATYAVVRPLDACAVAPEVHRAGEARTLVPWFFDGEDCRRASLEMSVQPLGEPVALDAFARAAEHVEERGSRIGAVVATTDDGARLTIGGFDHERGEVVRIEDPRVGTLRWVPARVAFEGAGEALFADARCSSSVATKIARDAVCPLTAALVFEDDCGTSRFHALGAAVDRASLHARDAKGACSPSEAEGVLAFERGAPIAPSALARAYVVEVGGPNVRRRGHTGAGGSVATWGALVDVATREPCAPAVAHDGSRRCLPVASASVTLFADETCTTRAFEQPITSCDRGAFPRFVQSAGEGGARVFEVTGEATELFDASAGTCRRHTPVVASRGFGVREVDVARFAPAGERELP